MHAHFSTPTKPDHQPNPAHYIPTDDQSDACCQAPSTLLYFDASSLFGTVYVLILRHVQLIHSSIDDTLLLHTIHSFILNIKREVLLVQQHCLLRDVSCPHHPTNPRLGYHPPSFGNDATSTSYRHLRQQLEKIIKKVTAKNEAKEAINDTVTDLKNHGSQS